LHVSAICKNSFHLIPFKNIAFFLQEYGKQSAANIDALKKELWNPMLLPQEKLFRGPQWSPEYPAKLVNSLDLSAEAQLDSRWSNMSQLGWAMFDASAAPVT
jgi:hypothetical protein